MRWKSYLNLFCFFTLSHQLVFADVNLPPVMANNNLKTKQEERKNYKGPHFKKKPGYCKKKSDSCHKKREYFNPSQLGIAAFNVLDSSSWYTIFAPPFPLTGLASLNRNAGSVQGEVELTSTGLLIARPGNYAVSFSILLSHVEDPNNTLVDGPVIQVFLAVNGVFDPNNPLNIGTTQTLRYDSTGTLQGSGILENVIPGTTLSLVISNGETLESLPLRVGNWNISVFKIPGDSRQFNGDNVL